MINEPITAIILTGTMGVGKTSVLGEASDILSSHGITHATIDLDMLGMTYVHDQISRELMLRNLASVWSNYRAAGVTRLLLAEAVESHEDIKRIRAAIPDVEEIIICRVWTTTDVAEERVRRRERGMLRAKYVARVAELDRILDDAGLEDFSVTNERTSVTDAAREMLSWAGWL